MTRRAKNSSGRSLLWVAMRLLWAVLVGLHMHVFTRVLAGGLEDGMTVAWIAQSVAIAGTVAFFVLKLMGVRWLRMRSHRHACVAFLLAAAVAHHDVVVTPNADVPPTWIVVATGIVGLEAWRSRRTLLGTAFLFRAPPRLALSVSGVIVDVRGNDLSQGRPGAASTRGPPARA